MSATAPTGSNLTVGDLWFDTNNIMMVYGSGGFQNAGSSVNGISRADFVVVLHRNLHRINHYIPAVYDAGL